MSLSYHCAMAQNSAGFTQNFEIYKQKPKFLLSLYHIEKQLHVLSILDIFLVFDNFYGAKMLNQKLLSAQENINLEGLCSVCLGREQF